MDTAKQELYEETGTLKFEIKPVCVYSVTKLDNFDGEESFGMLLFADIQCFGTELHSGIEKIVIMDEFPEGQYKQNEGVYYFCLDVEVYHAEYNCSIWSSCRW